MIKVVMLDDHPVVTGGLKSALAEAENIEVTAIYNTAESLLSAVSELDANVLILDMQLPDGNGYDIAMAVRKAQPRIAILVFTNTDTLYLVKKMQQAGCLGYLLKNAGNQTLYKAIGAVSEGFRFLSPELEKALMDDMFTTKNNKTSKIALTRREQEVLQLIVKEYTTQEIAEALFITASAIEFHRNNLLQKLGAKNSAGLVRVAMEAGLV